MLVCCDNNEERVTNETTQSAARGRRVDLGGRRGRSMCGSSTSHSQSSSSSLEQCVVYRDEQLALRPAATSSSASSGNLSQDDQAIFQSYTGGSSCR